MSAPRGNSLTTWKPLAGFGFRFEVIVAAAEALIDPCSCAVTVEVRTCSPAAAVAAVALDPTNKAAVIKAAARAAVDFIVIPQSP